MSTIVDFKIYTICDKCNKYLKIKNVYYCRFLDMRDSNPVGTIVFKN